MGGHAVACLEAALYGFDTENTVAIHMLNPGVRIRPTVGLMVHQRRCPAPAGVGRRDAADCRGGLTVAPPAGAGHPRSPRTVNALRFHGEINAVAARPPRASSRRADSYPSDGRAESAMESQARLVGRPRAAVARILPDTATVGEIVASRLRLADMHLMTEYESIGVARGTSGAARQDTLGPSSKSSGGRLSRLSSCRANRPPGGGVRLCCAQRLRNSLATATTRSRSVAPDRRSRISSTSAPPGSPHSNSARVTSMPSATGSVGRSHVAAAATLAASAP